MAKLDEEMLDEAADKAKGLTGKHSALSRCLEWAT